MAETAATRTAAKPAVILADIAAAPKSEIVSQEVGEAISSMILGKSTLHREIYIAMCANINPAALTSMAQIMQMLTHIRNISEHAAHKFENPAVKPPE